MPFFSFSPNFSPPNLVFSWPRHPDLYSGTEFFSPDSCWAPWPPALPPPPPPRGGGRQLYLGGLRGTLGTVDPSCSRAARAPAARQHAGPCHRGPRAHVERRAPLACSRRGVGISVTQRVGLQGRLSGWGRGGGLPTSGSRPWPVKRGWGLPRPEPTSRPRTPLQEAAWGKSPASPPRGRGSGGNAIAAETGVERRVPGEPRAAPSRCLSAPAPTQPADTRPAPLGPAAWAPTCHDPYPGPGPG